MAGLMDARLDEVMDMMGNHKIKNQGWIGSANRG